MLANLIKLIYYFEPFWKFSIEGILKENFNGKQILLYYEKNNSLDTRHRSMLSNCIVEYIIQSKLDPKRENFNTIAENIIQFFITENKVSYLPRFGGSM